MSTVNVHTAPERKWWEKVRIDRLKIETCTDGQPCEHCYLMERWKKVHYTSSGARKVNCKKICRYPQGKDCPLKDNEYYAKTW